MGGRGGGGGGPDQPEEGDIKAAGMRMWPKTHFPRHRLRSRLIMSICLFKYFKKILKNNNNKTSELIENSNPNFFLSSNPNGHFANESIDIQSIVNNHSRPDGPNRIHLMFLNNRLIKTGP